MKHFRYFFLLIAFAGFWVTSQAQISAPLGSWTPYVSYAEVLDIDRDDNTVYVVAQGGLFTFNIDSREVRGYSTTDGLSGVSPSTVYYDEINDLVFIGYQDGQIDFFRDPSQILYITDIERTDLFSTKNIYQFFSTEGLVYIATDFGIVVYDIDRRETRGSFTKIGTNDTGVPVYDIEINQDTIWAAMGMEGLWYAPMSHPNLADPTAWDLANGHDGLSDGRVPNLASTGEILYTNVEDTLYRFINNAWVKAPVGTIDIKFIKEYDNILTVGYSGSSIWTLYADSSTSDFSSGGAPNAAISDDSLTWLGDRSGGLVSYENGAFAGYLPNGPKNNYVTEMVANNGELYIAPRGKNGTSGNFGDDSGVSYHTQETGWIINDERTQRLSVSTVYRDFARVCYDPLTQHAYAGSWREGIMEFYKGDTVRSYTAENSDITYFAPNDIRISGMAVDNSSNLWTTQVFAQADEILNVKTPDDEWYAFKVPGILAHGLLIDDFGNKWIRSDAGGIAVYNENGTYDDLSDDDIKYITNNTGSGGLPNMDVYSFAKDLDGNIWVGTSSGIVVFYDPGSVFTNFFQDATCPIFSGRCLLKDQPVNTIAVDGANRKWVGTNDGVYLLSEDGTEQELRFTTENSPLLSNTIEDIVIDGTTGEVFIGTASGIISYMGDAIEGAETSENLTVFPNPVLSSYTGPITIRGSVADSKYKITTVSGLLVKEIESNGGQAVWDGTDVRGNRVESGVYLVLVANDDGEGAGVTKIAFINQD